MRRKILHISQAPIGGVVEYLKLYFNNYDQELFDQELICPSEGNITDVARANGIKANNIKMVREISPLTDLKSIIEIRGIIKEVNPDIIYLHSSKAGALGRIAALGLSNKVVYNAHGWSFTIKTSNIKKSIYGKIERVLAHFTDLIINVSKDEYEQALIYKIPKEKMITVTNAIDVDLYKKHSKSKFFEKFVIGFVGRLDEQKNPMFLIDIALEIIPKIPNALFYVVGDGELKKEFTEKINQNQLNQYFYMAGWSSNVAEEICNFDVALMISKWEGFGLVVCEYMAARKPVIGVPVGGVKNIINHKKNGILVSEYNPSEFSEYILELKEDVISKDSIANQAYIDVTEKYSIKAMMAKQEKLLLDLS
ncbi:glycosyltransferase [Priestia megaterium]|uniref:glycosyltransferase family 4 protein n=1 Tax=Priestia megaterium TaxID=1404 RepID=UPI000D51F6BA|nr:glycosyltransferase family 4 protein [Priestia megaterium]PVC76048.1 glycosyltransferase [Priestia megaterium]